MQLSTILDHIENGHIALPEFQRGYVWNRDQVRRLMDSLYREHPVGSLLTWATRSESAEHRGDQQLAQGVVKLLLDGQQRITSLYGIIRGEAPAFFDGNADAFTGLHFHIEREEFAFYSPIKMRDDPAWINVGALMKEGLGPFFTVFGGHPEASVYLERLNRISSIKSRVFHIEEVTGADKTIDVVVDIFNRVNSGGTKLSKGDLALAKVCAGWPDARNRMRQALARWDERGFPFTLEWLLRVVNVVTTGEARYTALHHASTEEFAAGLDASCAGIDTILNLVSGRLGLDDGSVLFGRYAFPILVAHVHRRGGRIETAEERDKLLGWYAHAALWGRFSGSTESELDKNLAHLAHEDALDRLIEDMRLWRGSLRIEPAHFGGSSRGDRFYKFLYMLTRMGESIDFGSGIPLRKGMLGRKSRLHLHHIFPKALLYNAGYNRSEVNAVANMCFLTEDANLRISASDPAVYLPEVEARHPGALATQWVPMDPDLWQLDRYPDFLAERRRLLSRAANAFLDGLVGRDPTLGPAEVEQAEARRPARHSTLPGGIASEEEEELLRLCNAWVVEHGLGEGEILYELRDDAGVPQAFLDLAWPAGLQAGLSQPAALLIDEGAETLGAANAAGFRYFTRLEDFKRYVLEEVLASETSRPRLFLGNYEVQEELTAGGMGRVYRVRESGDETDLFLKAVPVGAHTDVKALQREISIYQRLRFLDSSLSLSSDPFSALVRSHEEGRGRAGPVPCQDPQLGRNRPSG